MLNISKPVVQENSLLWVSSFFGERAGSSPVLLYLLMGFLSDLAAWQLCFPVLT